MSPKRRKGPRSTQHHQSAAAAESSRRQDTTRLINSALEEGNDIARLRQIAAVRGLVSTELRARLWPVLLAGSDSPLLSPGTAGQQQQQQPEARALSRRNSTEAGGAAALGRRASISPAPAGSGGVGGGSTGNSGSSSPRRGHAGGAASSASTTTTTSSSSSSSSAAAGGEYEQWAAGEHKDTTTVHVDVQRSLHSFASFLDDGARAARRAELERMLNAVVVKHEGDVHYYQGLHDVASVLLLVAGEPSAFDMLCRLSVGHLRDATRPSLDAVIELLGLLGPIVAAADEELARFLQQQGLPPFYALSWAITWFAHDLRDFGEVCRLFDLFMATHPLMPLYVGAAAMHSQRAQLLAAEEMPVLHSKLVNMSATRALTADQLAIQAIKLYKRATPESIIASRQLMLQQCISPRVELRGGVWHYPPPQVLGPGLWNQHRLQALMQQLLRLPLPGTPAQRKRLVLASLTGVLSTLYVVGLCVFVARNPNASPLSLLNRL